MTKTNSRAKYEPGPEIVALWPDASGNDTNGQGSKIRRRPKAVFWRDDLSSFPHGQVQRLFWQTSLGSDEVKAAWARRQEALDLPISDVAPKQEQRLAEEWTRLVKQVALDSGADDVGICAYEADWTFDDRPIPAGKWAIVLIVAHDYDNFKDAPSETALAEVVDQYGRAASVSKLVASWLQEHGWEADAKTGPRTEDVLMIPAAVAAGVGELGKHGSIINRRFGSSVRLSLVLTDVPLNPDRPDPFGADEFCQSCQVCTNACPPEAIVPDKQWVRGDLKWYVDFDKCVPYFVENLGCGICLAVCPWSRPGIAEKLVVKMARRAKARNATVDPMTSNRQAVDL